MREVGHGVNVEGGTDLLNNARITKQVPAMMSDGMNPGVGAADERGDGQGHRSRRRSGALISACRGLVHDGPSFGRNLSFGRSLSFSQGLIAALLMIIVSVSSKPADAQRGFKLIRDVEIEALLTDVTYPILDAAGIARSSVNIFIVQDSNLNAFVAGGQNLFLNTGLLMRAEHPGQLAGVIAHEVGHIAGGHLSRIGGAQGRAVTEIILSTVLGAAAAVAGAPALGTAIIAGGQTVAQNEFLSFSRSQEQAADQAGVSYLKAIDVSTAGLAEFFHILDEQSLLSARTQNPYLRSHPLTRDRIRFAESHAQPVNGDSPEFPPAWGEQHKRMVAKLTAFLGDPGRALQKANSNSLPDRYQRAIALYRLPDLDGAVAEIDGLLADYPDDPYFHELKGQMLFENGRIVAAIQPYRDAVRLKPVPLLQVGLGRALMESGEASDGREAIDHFKAAVREEPRNAGAWRLLGIAQGRAGEEADSYLSLAEWALLTGKNDDAKLHAKRAENRIGPEDPGWLQLQDILRAIEDKQAG